MIKKLQNNFTTPEQSKRLLELGVPADSADCFFDTQYFGGNIVQTRMFSSWRTSHNLFCGVFSDIVIPCWSVGRLIEIYSLCVTCDPNVESPVLGSCNNIELFVNMLEFAKNIYVLDFSKLEE